MAPLTAARRQENRWPDGVIEKNTLQILIFLNNNHFHFITFKDSRF